MHPRCPLKTAVVPQLCALCRSMRRQHTHDDASLEAGSSCDIICAGSHLQIYAAMCGKTGRPHHLYRLILLTPAGFLKKTPWVSTVQNGSRA